jgi:indole-3-glycerol phosphate synthase
MPVSLGQILASTRTLLPPLIARRAELERLATASPPGPSFEAALAGSTLGLIAEVKRRSPSAGSINEAIDPAAQAGAYALGGASAISVLTDTTHFGGTMDDLRAVVSRVRVPVLRKDFILAEEQILEARAAGASAILLIVRALTPARLRELHQFAADLEVASLVEAHTRPEVEVALEAGALIVGVNSRDLDTFRIDVDAAWRLLRMVPAGIVAVAESGMATPQDVALAAKAGADAVLVGTALSSAADPAGLARSITRERRHGR